MPSASPCERGYPPWRRQNSPEAGGDVDRWQHLGDDLAGAAPSSSHCGQPVQIHTLTDRRRSVTLLVVPLMEDDRPGPSNHPSPSRIGHSWQRDPLPPMTRVPRPCARPYVGRSVQAGFIDISSVPSDSAPLTSLQSAGGWLCDRARAGWDVSVLVADREDPRPLTILGATTLDRGVEFASMVRTPSRIAALAVSAGLGHHRNDGLG